MAKFIKVIGYKNSEPLALNRDDITCVQNWRKIDGQQMTSIKMGRRGSTIGVVGNVDEIMVAIGYEGFVKLSGAGNNSPMYFHRDNVLTLNSNEDGITLIADAYSNGTYGVNESLEEVMALLNGDSK